MLFYNFLKKIIILCTGEQKIKASPFLRINEFFELTLHSREFCFG